MFFSNNELNCFLKTITISDVRKHKSTGSFLLFYLFLCFLFLFSGSI